MIPEETRIIHAGGSFYVEYWVKPEGRKTRKKMGVVAADEFELMSLLRAFYVTEE